MGSGGTPAKIKKMMTAGVHQIKVDLLNIPVKENRVVPHAGSNFTSANSTLAPKLRGLMLPRGSGLHVGISGIGLLTNGFYVNVQGVYY